ncbi:MAG: tetratricopeptide repeat protein [Nitrospiria bacterium]
MAAGLAAASTVATPALSEPPDRTPALKKAVVAFNASLLTMRENAASPAPHLEILFDVDGRGDTVPAHHLPSWIKVSLDRHPPKEYSYTDAEWHALAKGGLQLLFTVPAVSGPHTLTVAYKGIDRNGKTYLKTRTLAFTTTQGADHRVLRFRADVNHEPQLTLEAMGASLFQMSSPELQSPASRLGLFAAETGDHGAAAGWFLAAADGKPADRRLDDRFRLAEAYAAIGLPEEAETLLKALLQDTSNPASVARAWMLIERIAFRGGRHAQVLEAYERLGPGLSPEDAGEAHLMAALSALAQRAFPQAATIFRRVPKSGVDGSLALYGQAQALSGLGDGFTAAGLLRKLIDSRSVFDGSRSRVVEHAHAALGFQWTVQGRYEEAVAELAQVPEGHSAYEGAQFGMAWALRQMDEHVQAIAVFQGVVNRFPEGAYAHEARILLAASYADLRAPTRSVKAYRTALDVLGASLAAIDRERATVGSPDWDPLAVRPRTRGGVITGDPAFVPALDRHRWLVRFQRDLRRTTEHFPSDLTAARSGQKTLGSRLHTLDGSQLAGQAQELLQKLDNAVLESRRTLAGLAGEALDREHTRIEEWSVQAVLGIARNLRDEMGGDVLLVD